MNFFQFSILCWIAKALPLFCTSHSRRQEYHFISPNFTSIESPIFLYVERRSPVLEVVVINMAVTVGFIADAEPGVNDGRDMTLSGEWWTLKQGAQAPNLRDFASG